jgi:flagella basal body P-ring formation protein FlgA
VRPRRAIRIAIALVASLAGGFGASSAGAQALADAAAAPTPQAARAGEVGKAGGAATATHSVAARDLARGETLTPEDIASAAAPAGAATPASVVGWMTRRVISEGEPLLPPAVAPPDLVKAGDPVEAVWRGRTIQLRVKGTAAGSAALGERVLVRVDARRRLEGVVIGPALVELESMDRGR